VSALQRGSRQRILYLLELLKMNAESHPPAQTKNCPICSQTLPLSEFGICRARKDGRNLYCKSCIRKKVTDSRRALKEFRSARKKYASEPILENATVLLSDGQLPSSTSDPRTLRRMSPLERVKEAIRNGARTHNEIRKGAKLSDDEVGDALASLLLWTREVRTELIDNDRIYFINELESANRENHQIPKRKPDVPSSFSALQGLMPGRNPEGETEKLAGWVAA
jgi:hypothetical protein